MARSNKLYRVDGSNVPSSLHPRLTELTPPALSDFGTWVNRNSCELFQKDDAVRIWHGAEPGAGGANISARVRPIPSGSWNVTLGCIRGFSFKNYLNGGLVLRESATGKIKAWGFGAPSSGGIHLQYYTSPTAFSANNAAMQEFNIYLQFFNVRKNGSSIEYRNSLDGVCWGMAYSEAMNANFSAAPDQWGFYLEANNDIAPRLAAQMDVIHWSE